jgi:hypothetical protein
MNWKKFFIAFVVTWIWIFVFGFIFHAKIMHPYYLEISTMLRPEADFNSHFPLLVVGQGVIAFFFTMIFVRGFGSGGGTAGGFRYGILLALLWCGANLIDYAVEPLTTTILIAWCIGVVIEFAVAGVIVGMLYKPSAPA